MPSKRRSNTGPRAADDPLPMATGLGAGCLSGVSLQLWGWKNHPVPASHPSATLQTHSRIGMNWGSGSLPKHHSVRAMGWCGSTVVTPTDSPPRSNLRGNLLRTSGSRPCHGSSVGETQYRCQGHVRHRSAYLLRAGRNSAQPHRRRARTGLGLAGSAVAEWHRASGLPHPRPRARNPKPSQLARGQALRRCRSPRRGAPACPAPTPLELDPSTPHELSCRAWQIAKRT